jgi:hypothetical protein
MEKVTDITTRRACRTAKRATSIRSQEDTMSRSIKQQHIVKQKGFGVPAVEDEEIDQVFVRSIRSNRKAGFRPRVMFWVGADNDNAVVVETPMNMDELRAFLQAVLTNTAPLDEPEAH